MTTSVIYGSSMRGQNIQYGTVDPGVTAATIYSNLTTFLTTKVTRTRFTNNTGSTTNPTATFSATPANGSALIAVILRTADNTTTTLSGWTQLSNAGAGGVRQAAVWWKRAGASEPTVVTATNSTAAAWNMTIIEYGGWATLADPVSISNSATVSSTTSIPVPGTGMMAGVCAIVNGAGSWTSATLATTTGSNASLTQFAATTLANCSEIVGYNNSEDAACTFTLGTARATNRLVVGWPHSTTSTFASFGTFAGISPSSSSLAGQIGLEFDTSSIPAANTVSSATLTMKAAGSSPLWPSTATSEIFSINSTDIAKTASNTRTVWRTPTEITALTKVATRAAASAWVASTAYAWTSEAAFISNINQAGTTRLLVGTSEQRTGTFAGSQQVYNISDTAGDHFLTIVHQREVTIPTVTAAASARTVTDIVAYLRTLPTVSAAAGAAISRTVSLSRTIAAAADASPLISRVVSLSRTIAASVDASPIVERVVSLSRTLAATVGAVPGIVATYLPFTTQLPRIIRLAARSTITLVTQSTLRLLGRSTLKLPKE
jgi:hypothetical protein